MKKKIYKMLMVAAAATTLISCGGTKALKEFPSKDVRLSGTHSWYIEVAEDNIPLTLAETDCDTLFLPSLDVTLTLLEKVNLPSGLTAEFKDLSIYSSSLDRMKLSDEGREALADLLSGGANKSKSINFVSEDKVTKSDFDEYLKHLKDDISISINGATFTSNGKVHKKELFNCVFNNAKIGNVISDYEGLVDDLKKAYYAYEDDQTSSKYEKFDAILKRADIYTSKLEECVDMDEDLSSSQMSRLEDAMDGYEKISYKL